MSLFIKERGEAWNHMHTLLQTSVCSKKKKKNSSNSHGNNIYQWTERASYSLSQLVAVATLNLG